MLSRSSAHPQGGTPTVAVLSLGFDLTGLGLDAPQVLAFPTAPAREDLEAWRDAVSGALDRADHAMIVYPSWMDEPALQRLQTVKSALAAERLALHQTSLPPLAGGVLCVLGAALGPHLRSAGELVAALRALERRLIVVAWLGSVSRLHEPSPSVAQHLSSLWPRSAYGVVLQPEPLVRRLSRRRPGFPLARADEPMELVLAPREGADVDWFTTAVNPALGNLPLRQVNPTHHGASWWGTPRLVEAVAYPRDPVATAGSLQLRLHLCSWCGEAVAGSPCPFCGQRDETLDPRI